jgi:NADPH:quinone reductase
MKAVIVKQAGGPEVLKLVDIDEPEVASGEVKIRVKAFGLNKAESYYRSGNFGPIVADQALGIEAVGYITDDPSGTYRVGQKVATAMGGMMFARHGGYAENITVNVSNVIAINSNISYTELAAIPEAYLTVWGALDKTMGIKEGDILLVRGATSGVGMAAVIYAKYKGLEVVATTRQKESVEKLKKIGADHVIVDNGNIHEQVRAIYPQGVNHALEVVGAGTVKDTFKAVKQWGEVVVVGLLSGPPVIDSLHLMSDLPNTVKLSFFGSGILGTASLPLADSPLNDIAEKVFDGVMPSTLTKVFDVTDIQDAHRLLDSGTANGKIVVTF